MMAIAVSKYTNFMIMNCLKERLWLEFRMDDQSGSGGKTDVHTDPQCHTMKHRQHYLNDGLLFEQIKVWMTENE